MIIFGFLPLLVLILIFITFSTVRRAYPPGILFLDSLLVWGTLTVILTEVLSLGRLLQPLYVIVAWLLTALVLTVVIIIKRPVPLRKIYETINRSFSGYYVLLVVLVAVGAILLVTALVAPPNFWDAITYHMSRVAYWAQNHSVNHYKTDDARQLYMAPFTSFLILHFQLLAGSDIFANVVGWLSLVGSAVAVYLTTTRLGAPRGGAILATVYTFTLPTAVLEASSVQTNLPTALWLSIFAYFLLFDLDEESPQNWVRIGIALGLAILSKYTTAFYALPLVCWYGIHKMRKSPGRAIRLALVIAVIAAAINLPHFSRNYTLFGSPLYPERGRTQHVNAQIGIRTTVSNLTRNTVQHLATPNYRINQALLAAVQKIHAAIDMDTAAPETSLSSPFQVFPLTTHEAATGNLLHLVLASAASILTLLTSRNRRAVWVAIMPLAGFVLFSSLVKWGPYNTRLHLPPFVLAAPVFGYISGRYLKPVHVKVVGLVLILLSLPWVLANQFRPILPIQRFTSSPSILASSRADQYFASLPASYELQEQYTAAADVLLNQSTCRRIGFDYVGKSLTPEYLVWVTLQQFGEDFTIVFPGKDFDYIQNNPNHVCAILYIGENVATSVPGELPHAQVWHWEDIGLSIQTDYIAPHSGDN